MRDIIYSGFMGNPIRKGRYRGMKKIQPNNEYGKMRVVEKPYNIEVINDIFAIMFNYDSYRDISQRTDGRAQADIKA